jgi:hypothetical protein
MFLLTAAEQQSTSSPGPADGLHGTGIYRFLAVAGPALARSDDLRLFVLEFEHLRAHLRTMTAADAKILINNRYPHAATSFRTLLC